MTFTCSRDLLEVSIKFQRLPLCFDGISFHNDKPAFMYPKTHPIIVSICLDCSLSQYHNTGAVHIEYTPHFKCDSSKPNQHLEIMQQVRTVTLHL